MWTCEVCHQNISGSRKAHLRQCFLPSPIKNHVECYFCQRTMRKDNCGRHFDSCYPRLGITDPKLILKLKKRCPNCGNYYTRRYFEDHRKKCFEFIYTKCGMCPEHKMTASKAYVCCGGFYCTISCFHHHNLYMHNGNSPIIRKIDRERQSVIVFPRGKQLFIFTSYLIVYNLNVKSSLFIKWLFLYILNTLLKYFRILLSTVVVIAVYIRLIAKRISVFTIIFVVQLKLKLLYAIFARKHIQLNGTS